LQIKL